MSPIIPSVIIVGGGLAGCEAAWQLACRGLAVTLFEMRPEVPTVAHKTSHLCELVCSNSLKSNSLDRPAGILKAEMRLLGSLIIACADEAAIPGGTGLTVDRDRFSDLVQSRLLAQPQVNLVREEVRKVPHARYVVIATGPLTSPALMEDLGRRLPQGWLHFYDAVSPIVSADSLKWDRVFEASRYGKGDGGYLNCPMTREEYVAFHESLVSAEVSPSSEYPKDELFEGCLPIEEIARRGLDALRFGPMKPVGLTDPSTGRRPWAVAQLRKENAEGTMYNLVGFQTGLRWGEQDRVFQIIPGLDEAEFLRYGVMHRNAFVDGPRCLTPMLELNDHPGVHLAGQITGVEGYVESAMCGLFVGINLARRIAAEQPVQFPRETMCGSLIRYVTSSPSPHFAPMNANFGLLPPVDGKNKTARREVMAERAVETMKRWCTKAAGGELRAMS